MLGIEVLMIRGEVLNTRRTGDNFEEVAVRFLQEHGYEILERNYRCRLGEIDIIAKDHCYLVFIEVKYRSTTNYGLPIEAVDINKQRKIYKVAQWYLKEHHVYDDINIRFDVVGILGKDIKIYKNAFGSM